MRTSVVRPESGREERAGVRAPGDVGCVEETAERLAHMRQSLRLGGEAGERRGEDLAPFGIVEVGHEGANRSPAEVEPAVQVAARGEEEQRATNGAGTLLAVEANLGARDRREHHDRDREAVLVALGKGALEVGEPRRRHGYASVLVELSDGRSLATVRPAQALTVRISVRGLSVVLGVGGAGEREPEGGDCNEESQFPQHVRHLLP